MTVYTGYKLVSEKYLEVKLTFHHALDPRPDNLNNLLVRYCHWNQKVKPLYIKDLSIQVFTRYVKY